MGLQLHSERREDGIVTLWLGNPHLSALVLDAWLLDQLHLFFDDLESQPPPTGFILMSASPHVFAAGADLAEIDQFSDDQLLAHLTEGADAFARISALPCPSVAAVNGTTLGGGLEIALHCDGLIAAQPALGGKPGLIGLPEAGLGLCPGWGGTQMLPARIDPAVAISMAATGDTKTIGEHPAGLIDCVIDNAVDLYEAAVHWVEAHPDTRSSHTPKCIDDSNRQAVSASLAKVRGGLPDTPASHAVVEAIEIGIAEGWAAAIAAERRLLVSLRHTDVARAQLEAFFIKTA